MSQSTVKPMYHKVKEERKLSERGGTAFKLVWDKRMNEEAGCRGLDTELFYPDRDVFSKEEERLFARMCIECPVMLQCLEWGLAHERYGIWGGTTPMMRQRERRRRGWLVNDPDTKI